MKRVLILEPYYGGSHKLFLQGLQKNIPGQYTLLQLPARKWKSRMQLSAIWFIERINEIPVSRRRFDTVLCSTFVDVAVLRALLQSVAGWNSRCRILCYFHENQFAYPGQAEDPGSQQFAAINFTTAMASDSCGFNSRYNLDSFLHGIRHRFRKLTDMKLLSSEDEIRERSVILYPGMDYHDIDSYSHERKRCRNDIPVIVWNHRWEHDKGPELFFDALRHLKAKGDDFRLIVLGQSFARQPSCFAAAREEFAAEILHFGYAETRKEYVRLLCCGDLVLSTAKHEFFGIAILEAIRSGCYPLLPDTLAYPELYDSSTLYPAGNLDQLVGRLMAYMARPVQYKNEEIYRLTSRFEWTQCRDRYEKWLYA